MNTKQTIFFGSLMAIFNILAILILCYFRLDHNLDDDAFISMLNFIKFVVVVGTGISDFILLGFCICFAYAKLEK